MKDIKKLLIGLPLFNLIVITLWWGLGSLERRYTHVTDNPAPITIVGFVVLLLLMGGFAVCGIVFGVFKTRKYSDGWKNIGQHIIVLTLITKGIYLLFYFFSQNNHYGIIRDTSIITMEQILGYAVGCGIGKLIRH